jgi:hypothetical protein
MRLDQEEPATLSGLLDGLLDSGLHLTGDLVIGLADVELIRVAVRLLVASEETARRTGTGISEKRTHNSTAADDKISSGMTAPSSSALSFNEGERPPLKRVAALRTVKEAGNEGVAARPSSERPDPERLCRGFSQLVLTLVELLRNLLERQAIRRVEGGSLTEHEIERLGVALQAVDERIEELKEVFGLTDEDLNLDLGALGKLR